LGYLLVELDLLLGRVVLLFGLLLGFLHLLRRLLQSQLGLFIVLVLLLLRDVVGVVRSLRCWLVGGEWCRMRARLDRRRSGWRRRTRPA
jgi:hypothetical protein